MANHEDDCTFFDNIASAIELLDISIEDALNNKRILDTRLDRAVSLKREVELKEKAAEEAKEDAAKSGLDILAKVEALKQAQQPLKETNDMVHAREVYEQKVGLAKKLKELQLRMSGVSNEGRRSLVVSDEMHKVLKRRLTKASKEKDLADNHKLENRKMALEALAFEESQMLKLVNQSNRLKQEAVKNSKLQECFKERESVINILQGEVSDKHQDINLFIERLDQPILKRVLSSKQTSVDLDQVGSTNGSFEVKSAPMVKDITEVGHSPSTVKHAVKTWKIKEKTVSSAQRKIASAGEIHRG
ncbi:hypothetical protein M8C21_009554 [Ambrosia artemisiifolia]|uniref:Uncharacterized protein n=1 Tax=Ambrosia artemisiifolia TaxID=4212 RepID=A0AAD5CDB5_AMBAR|nr:hypothetical protein M8C21_009554 [Ambrosia artemisiifolia]